MKKVIAAVLIVVVLAAGIYLIYDQVIANPERLIVGTWNNTELTNLGYTFNKDGTMTGNIDLLGFGVANIEGTYEIDKKQGIISMTYSFASISHTDKRVFEFDGDNLTLSDTNTNYVGHFARAEED